MVESLQLRQALRVFLNKAEAAWFDVYGSSFDRREINVGGTEYIQLPLRYSTRAKIYAYFRKYWGITFSRIQLRSLKSIVHNGRVYVILGDPGPIPNFVESVRILSITKTRIRVRAMLSGDPDGNVPIYYTIARTSSGYKIISRSGKRYDYRFTINKL
ncbi:DL-endopeptidase inhibitor IseA family protein [Paenibacillus sp. BC26]|uniref:DL-endopeptidase inhibitor IseA family protein n=1 Tax=Paenibacillus sp. BC26 TaxID=1881032 RepID=UPI0008E686C6|nr:DL-endopeptidase inhibitor IseA family protein [Paenibacillus sp. BC26]SFS50643.1 IseA DL-endopeptidase inhibitor [Paenibacillus sp. BC26]